MIVSLCFDCCCYCPYLSVFVFFCCNRYHHSDGDVYFENVSISGCFFKCFIDGAYYRASVLTINYTTFIINTLNTCISIECLPQATTIIIIIMMINNLVKMLILNLY